MSVYFLFALLVLAFSAIFEVSEAAQKPVIILVPGAFHQAVVYDKVVAGLRKDGYQDAIAVGLPSVSAINDRKKDIEAVRSVMQQQFRKNRDVLLVGNSYGATVIGDAVKDFKDRSIITKDQPAFRGGRILGLVFLSGYIPYITEVTDPASKPPIESVAPPFFRFEKDGRVYWDNDLAAYPPSKTFYNLLPEKEQKEWAGKLRFSTYAALAANATYIPYTGDFKTIYVIGRQDNSVPEAWAKTFIEQPGAKFEVRYLDADHVPMLSRPKEVVELLESVAGRGE
ncbi:alpha/beta-hydrolase [Corynespora cassiicola Philippines]|uniref:Alpha/beta-hydrolase n=1 Tax=Corynespora cassiicola Philippines TaxID=1448308 RepID=A0A2T2NB56_CORCC|nr:alpha/beta-hydrolase [Corynespora cassiicola Philippines]